ncbi:MAG TPA: hypothetical protein PLA78_05710 [Bacteroidales bacterium]|nr:hypothetical protein [Bacteroidales bacterium]
MLKREFILLIFLMTILFVFLENNVSAQRILWYGEFSYEKNWDKVVNEDSILNQWYSEISQTNKEYTFPEKISLKIEMTVWNINDSITAFTCVLKNLNLVPGIYYRNIRIGEIYEPYKASVFFTAKNTINQLSESCGSILTNKLGYYYADTCYYDFSFTDNIKYFSLDSLILLVNENINSKLDYYKKLINNYYEFNIFYERSLKYIDTLISDNPRLLLFHKYELDEIDKKIQDIGKMHLVEELKLYNNDPIDFISKYDNLKNKLFQKQKELNDKIEHIDSLLILESDKFFKENKKQESLENINYALQYNPNSFIAWNAYIKFYLKNRTLDTTLLKTVEFINKFQNIKYADLPKYLQATIDTVWNVSIEEIDYLFTKEEYNNAINILEQLKLINDGLSYGKTEQLDIYLTKNYYKLFENFITIFDKSIEKGFDNIALHILLEAQNFANNNSKYISVNDILEEKKNVFLQILSKGIEDLLEREAWEEAVEQIIMIDTLYKNPIFAQDSALLINYKNENLNKLTDNIIAKCSNYRVNVDNRKIKKSYEYLETLKNKFGINPQTNKFSNCYIKYQNVILKELIDQYSKKEIVGSRRHKSIKISYLSPTLSDAIKLLYLSEITSNALPDTLKSLSTTTICNYLEKTANSEYIILKEDSFIYLHSLAHCPQFIYEQYKNKIKVDTCEGVKNKYQKYLAIAKYYYNLDSLYQAKDFIIKAKNIWLNTLCEIDPLDLVNLEKSIELQLSFKHSMDSWQAMYKMATDTIYIQYQKLKFQYNALPDSLKNKNNLSSSRLIFFSTMQSDSLVKLSNLLANGDYLNESLEILKILKNRNYNSKYLNNIQTILGRDFASSDIKTGTATDYSRYVPNEDFYKAFIKAYNNTIKKNKKN